MRTNGLGRWVVRLSVVGVLGLFAFSLAHSLAPRYTTQDTTWAAPSTSSVSAR
jgi:hypothetical protein